MLLAAAVGCGLLAFLLAQSHVAQVDSQVGDTVTVYRIARQLPAFTTLGETDVYAEEVPKRWVPDNAYTTEAFLGRRTAVDMARTDFLTESSMVPRQDMERGEREIAIMVDAETGVAGRVSQGDYVNVNVTMQIDQPEGASQRYATVLIRRARVVSIGTLTSSTDDTGPSTSVPVTFALGERESLKLLYAESFATSIRLSKVAADDTEEPSGAGPYTSEDIEDEYDQGVAP